MPILDHTYSGPGHRLNKAETPAHKPEHILGAFEVVERTALYAVLDNGEPAEGYAGHGARWLVRCENLSRLEEVG